VKKILFYIVVVALAGCSGDDDGDGCVPVSKALKEISSLSNIVESGRVAGRPSCMVYAGARIYACEYKGKTTYYFTNMASSNAVCNGIVYDCHGDEILNWASDQAGWTAYEAERSDEKELWKKD